MKGEVRSVEAACAVRREKERKADLAEYQDLTSKT